jgi:hypothetical protein
MSTIVEPWNRIKRILRTILLLQSLNPLLRPQSTHSLVKFPKLRRLIVVDLNNPGENRVLTVVVDAATGEGVETVEILEGGDAMRTPLLD